MTSSILQKQLEAARFEHGIKHVENEYSGNKKLQTMELVHLNQILTGSANDPWRFEAAQVALPTGHSHHFSVLTNPLARARELLSLADIMEGNGDFIAAAQYLYTHLVREHLFQDANRRTAALAIYWILLANNIKADPHALIQLKVGNLHDAKEYADYINRLEELILKF